MSIVLDENAFAESAIKTKTLGKKPFETLYRVARYYLDSGHSKTETRKLLDSFLIQCNSLASLPKWSDTLDTALKRAVRYEAVKIEHIDITVGEIETIRSISSIQLQRLAFTLLCLAKYWKIVNPNSNGWVINPDNEIMRMANINTSHVRQNMMYNTLFEMGLIKLPKKVDSTSVQVCFEAPGENAISITDFVNLGYQYMMYCGNKNYFRCQNCGCVVKKPKSSNNSGRPPKWCASCAAEIRMKQNINSVMRVRLSS